VTQALTEVEMQSPDPAGLAEHWGRILEMPVATNARGEPLIKLPSAGFRFVRGQSEIMSGLTFRVANVAKVLDAARQRGLAVSGDSFDLCGVTFHLI
jgi:hypothetical protein